MQWKSCKEELPKDREEVLVREGGKYLLAVYEKQEKAFKLRNGKQINASDGDIKWTKLIAP